jgi:mono/diheme cytochrome c family protein
VPVPAGAQDGSGAITYQQTCAACHQVDATGLEGAFPPLAGNPNIAGPDDVIEAIRNGKQGPITVNGVVYDQVMPPVVGLTDAQIEAVASYVARLADGSETIEIVPPTVSGPGDAADGEDLFVGRTGLAAGGPACASCHSAGPYGGASLGPDLTDVSTRLGGEAGLTGWLGAPPSPTMQPIFSVHPLDDGEIASLVAYLGSIDGTESDRGVDVMLVGGGIGVAVLFGSMMVVFKRPRGRYLDQLRRRP